MCMNACSSLLVKASKRTARVRWHILWLHDVEWPLSVRRQSALPWRRLRFSYAASKACHFSSFQNKHFNIQNK